MVICFYQEARLSSSSHFYALFGSSSVADRQGHWQISAGRERYYPCKKSTFMLLEEETLVHFNHFVTFKNFKDYAPFLPEFTVQHVDRWYGEPGGLSIPLSPIKMKSPPLHGYQPVHNHISQFPGECTSVCIEIISQFTP